MDENNYIDLVRARIECAKELLEDAELLLEKGSYASANNRVYYALVKDCNGLLAGAQIPSKSHRGVIAKVETYLKEKE